MVRAPIFPGVFPFLPGKMGTRGPGPEHFMTWPCIHTRCTVFSSFKKFISGSKTNPRASSEKRNIMGWTEMQLAGAAVEADAIGEQQLKRTQSRSS